MSETELNAADSTGVSGLSAMKQALEALEALVVERSHEAMEDGDKAIAALRLAIEQAEKQEPVVNIELSRRMAAVKVSNFYGSIIKDAEKEIERLHGLVLQHTAPPQQEKQEPVALETVYETIIDWDEGGGKRSRRELARRIVDLYAEQAERQEPVAWVCEGSASDEKHAIDYWQEEIDAIPVGTMLYTAPPQRQPLTDEEIKAVIRAGEYDTMEEFARAIERKHRIGGGE